jgi:hypothetical protein
MVMLILAAVSLQGQERSAAGGVVSAQAVTELPAVPTELKVFPNPVLQSKFTVETGPHLIREIRITNIAGVQVYLRKFPVPVQRFEVATGSIPNGVYLLRVSNTGNSAKTLKLVISGGR